MFAVVAVVPRFRDFDDFSVAGIAADVIRAAFVLVRNALVVLCAANNALAMSVIMRRVAVNYFAAVLGPSPASVKCAEVVNITGEKVVRGALDNIDFAFGVSACGVKFHTRQAAAVSRLELSAVDLENRAYHDRFEFRALEEVVIGSDIIGVFVNAFVRYISVIEIGNSRHFDVLEVRALAERKSVKTGYTDGKRDFLKEFVALERAVTDELNGLFAVNAVVVYVHDRDFGFGEVLVIPYIIRARASVGVYEIFVIAVYHAVIVSRAALTAHVFAVEFVLAAADDLVVLIVGVTPLEARFGRGIFVVSQHVAAVGRVAVIERYVEPQPVVGPREYRHADFGREVESPGVGVLLDDVVVR